MLTRHDHMGRFDCICLSCFPCFYIYIEIQLLIMVLYSLYFILYKYHILSTWLIIKGHDLLLQVWLYLSLTLFFSPWNFLFNSALTFVLEVSTSESDWLLSNIAEFIWFVGVAGLEQWKSGLIRQVTSLKRFKFIWIFHDRKKTRWPFNTGDCLIEVTTWAGLTV
jgi:hypothetical protein